MADWTDKEIEVLRNLAANGLSASEVAAKLNKAFGTERTRNAVIGRAARNGIKFTSWTVPRSRKRRAPTIPSSQPRPPKKATTRQLLIRAVRKRRALIGMGKKTDSLIVDDELQVVGIPMLERRDGQCCFPLWSFYGEEPTDKKLVCGMPRVENKPYCAWHSENVPRG